MAAALRAYLSPLGLELPEAIRTEADPLEILRYAAGAGPLVAETVEVGLRGLELQAVLTATPTPRTAETVRRLRGSGRRLAVVGNDSDDCIKVYADRHGLLDCFDFISARALFQDPALLKPHPHLVTRAMAVLDADPERCVLVGDSVSDIESARAAGIRGIGYADRPGKERSFRNAGADAVITDMAQLVLGHV